MPKSSGTALDFQAQPGAAADKLRRYMDALESKHVRLDLIFLKFISDKFEEKREQLLFGFSDPKSESFIKNDPQRAEAAEDRDEYTFKGVLPRDDARPNPDKVRLGGLVDTICRIGFNESAARSKDVLGRIPAMKTLIHNCRIHLLVPIALLSLAATGLPAADFPQWRGPLRDGHSPETGLLQEWPKDGPKLLWQVNHVGAGYSTPSVVGEQIYLLGNEGVENESVIALSVKDGSRVWARKLGRIGHPEQDPSYPGARSTPTVDGNFLFALGSDGDLVCLETTNGKEIWRKHLRNDFGGKYGEWAYSESPLVDGDQLICTPGGTNATLVALNKRTGEVIWKCTVPGGSDASYSSVVSAEFSGVRQYLQFLATGLVGVDAQTGKLLWRFEKTAKGSPAVIITPLVSDGVVYSGAFRASSALVRPVLKEGAFTVEEIYSGAKLPIGLGGVVKVGDYFYGSSSQSALCVEFKTGALKWEERALGPCSWLVADGRIYLHAESGDVALIEPSAEAYREKGRFSPSNPPTRGQAKAWAYPVVANGRLYIREQNSLWYYDVKAGK